MTDTHLRIHPKQEKDQSTWAPAWKGQQKNLNFSLMSYIIQILDYYPFCFFLLLLLLFSVHCTSWGRMHFTNLERQTHRLRKDGDKTDGNRNYSKAHTSLLRRECSFMDLGPWESGIRSNFGGSVSFWQNPKSNPNSRRAHWSPTSSTIFSTQVRSSWEEGLLTWLATPLLNWMTKDCLWSCPPLGCASFHFPYVRVLSPCMYGFSTRAQVSWDPKPLARIPKRKSLIRLSQSSQIKSQFVEFDHIGSCRGPTWAQTENQVGSGILAPSLTQTWTTNSNSSTPEGKP